MQQLWTILMRGSVARRAGSWLGVAVLLLAAFVPATARSQHDDEARALFAAGSVAFSHGRYEEALEYFERAYGLSHRAEMLFNIGQAADRARHDQIALDAFERYLAGVADIENRAELEGRVRVLRASLSARTAAPNPETEPTPAPDSPPQATTPLASSPGTPPAPAATTTHDAGPRAGGTAIDVGGLVLTVSGGALAVAGAIMVALGAPDLGSARPGELIVDTQARGERGGILVGIGSPLIGVGVVAAIVGAVLLATSAPAPSSVLRFTPDGFQVRF